MGLLSQAYSPSGPTGGEVGLRSQTRACDVGTLEPNRGGKGRDTSLRTRMEAELGSRGPEVRLEGSKQLRDDFRPQERVSVRPWDGERSGKHRKVSTAGVGGDAGRTGVR